MKGLKLPAGLGEKVDNFVLKKQECFISGCDFPIDTNIDLVESKKCKYLVIRYPNGTTGKITHDMVKCATILAMGTIKTVMDTHGKIISEVKGIKYLIVLKDGKQAVLTAEIGSSQYIIESIIF